MVSFHNCGRATLLLEDIADTGPDAVETLTSNRSSGDVDLADAKRRIGDRVCLFGGFNEHLLHEGDADAVRDEVQALPRRGHGGRRLRAALDRADLRREAGPDRGHVRDRARSRPLQLSRGQAVDTPTTSTTSRRRPTGPPGALPLTAEFLRDSPSGDVFGLSQNAGMGWEASKVGRDQFLILSTQGGLRDDDGTPVALGYHTGHWEVGLLVREAALELDRLGGLPFAAARLGSRATAAARGRPGCSTRCRTATTRRSCCDGSSAACRGAAG